MSRLLPLDKLCFGHALAHINAVAWIHEIVFIACQDDHLGYTRPNFLESAGRHTMRQRSYHLRDCPDKLLRACSCYTLAVSLNFARSASQKVSLSALQEQHELWLGFVDSFDPWGHLSL